MLSQTCMYLQRKLQLTADKNAMPVEIAVETADQAALVRAEEADYFAFLNSDEFTPAKLKRRLASHDEYVQQPQRRPEP